MRVLLTTGSHRWLSALAVVWMVAPAWAQVVDATEASIRMLQRALTVQRDGSHLPLLFALRQLRDPDLRRIFDHLIQVDEWQVQVHGTLGLAEISTDRRVNPQLIKALALQAQDAVVATGLDLELMDANQLNELLEWPQLQDMARLVALAELVSLNQPHPKEDLQRLCTAEDIHAAAMASCLLAQSGDQSSLAALRTRLDSLPRNQKTETELWTLDAIRRYRLTACSDWVAQMLDQPSIPNDLAHRAVFTLVAIEPTAGMQAWAKQLASSDAMPHRVRYGLILLACAGDVPATTYEVLAVRQDEELLARIIAVGKTLAAKTDPVQSIIYLVDAQHAKSTEWVMEYLPKLPADQAASVYSHLIDRVADENSDGETIALAVRATARLIKIDPNSVLSHLAKAPDDSVQQQAILLAMFEADLPGANDAVGKLRRIGTGRADSLALLLLAKYSPTLESSDIQLLGKIASGGGRVSDILQVQAAWLYLKHTNQLEKTLAALFPAKK